MEHGQALIRPDELAFGWEGEARPFAIIDLDRGDDGTEVIVPPPFPLIGIGNARHRLAAQLDAVVEAPVSLDMLARAILANPQTAAVAVQTLRHIEALPVGTALHCESLAYGLLQGSGEHHAWRARRQRNGRTSVTAGEVHLSRHGDRLEMVLDRPDAGNAIDRPMRDALHDGFTLAAIDKSIAEVRLRAAGRTFSLGADLGEFGTTHDPATAHAIRMATLPALAIARCADRLDVHVQGGCVGAGLEMSAFASRLTATSTAWFQLPELKMGIIPGAGGCVSLTRRIGRQRAALMILSGKRVGARIALDWGLIDAIVDD